MRKRGLTALLGLAALAAVLALTGGAGASKKSSYEVWLVDQSNTNGTTSGGALYVYDGAALDRRGTPGLGLIRVRKDGRTGALTGIARIANVDAGGVDRADPHGLRVRLKEACRFWPRPGSDPGYGLRHASSDRGLVARHPSFLRSQQNHRPRRTRPGSDPGHGSRGQA
ncbi:MAG TPA: hypothetical protein VJ744_02395 [Gaiellaceae bacterium]|nr:hypothetical protein [Gaiellaceae bacterium]